MGETELSFLRPIHRLFDRPCDAHAGEGRGGRRGGYDAARMKNKVLWGKEWGVSRQPDLQPSRPTCGKGERLIP